MQGKRERPASWQKRMVRPLTVMVEIAGPCQLKPGYFCGDFLGGHFKRVWWLWVAVAWVRVDLPTYNRHIETGLTEWHDSMRPNEKDKRP